MAFGEEGDGLHARLNQSIAKLVFIKMQPDIRDVRASMKIQMHLPQQQRIIQRSSRHYANSLVSAMVCSCSSNR